MSTAIENGELIYYQDSKGTGDYDSSGWFTTTSTSTDKMWYDYYGTRRRYRPKPQYQDYEISFDDLPEHGDIKYSELGKSVVSWDSDKYKWIILDDIEEPKKTQNLLEDDLFEI